MSCDGVNWCISSGRNRRNAIDDGIHSPLRSAHWRRSSRFGSIGIMEANLLLMASDKPDTPDLSVLRLVAAMIETQLGSIRPDGVLRSWMRCAQLFCTLIEAQPISSINQTVSFFARSALARSPNGKNSASLFCTSIQGMPSALVLSEVPASV